MARIRKASRLLVISVGLIVLLSGNARGADQLYWTDASFWTINRANIDGSGVQVLVNTNAFPQSIAIDNSGGKMYWGEVLGALRRANLDGSGAQDLVLSIGPTGVALDSAGGKVYWTDPYVTGWIHRANLDGTQVENIVTFGSDREGLALDLINGKIYWTNRSWQSIERANLDGSGWEFLIPDGLADPRGIALDMRAGKMYWAELGSGSIRRANLDGSNVENLVTGLGQPLGFALDVQRAKMYWTDIGTHKIQRASLDGAAVEDLVVGLGIPAGIALDMAAGSTVVQIDVRPGDPTNSFNVTSAGVVPVAILSSATFNATQVDPASITLSGAAVKLVGKGANQACNAHDVNADGLLDLICQVETSDLTLEPGSSIAVLKAKTLSGEDIQGEDLIRIVP
ncbi:MAG TPA: hypothetical protein VFC18_04545 [Burkholderiales bacterium]|nr:hypothetical protein [Burkholderiales bacterium]